MGAYAYLCEDVLGIIVRWSFPLDTYGAHSQTRSPYRPRIGIDVVLRMFPLILDIEPIFDILAIATTCFRIGAPSSLKWCLFCMIGRATILGNIL